MKLIENIQIFLSNLAFKRANKIEREVTAINLKSAKKVGIIYRADHEQEAELVSRYVKFLRDYKIKIKTLGYFHQNSLPHDVNPKLEFDFFCKKDLNLWLQPNCSDVDNFIETHFDILIDLSTENEPVLRFVLNKSLAKFKIGCARLNYSNEFDMSFQIKEDEGVRQLMKVIDHYLHIINK